MVEKVTGILGRTSLLFILAIADFALCTFAVPVSGETVEEGPLKRNDWTISVIPYLWALSPDGELGIRDLEQDLDVPFSDLLENLNGVLMLECLLDQKNGKLLFLTRNHVLLYSFRSFLSL